ncbi:MAG: hypothetical protein ACT4OZ_00795 [Gemmatimonadota bacterium]
MLFRQHFLDGIRDGRITLAFRKWRRPSVKSGGTLLTAIGQLQIGEVRRVELVEITAIDAHRAGYASLTALRAELDSRAEGDLHRIEIGTVRADPRIALRSASITEGEQEALIKRLDRLDAAADGAWTRRVLRLIRDKPGVRAGDLCRVMGMEKQPFKINVRKLKALGLTESLEVGYRLSPRGQSLLPKLK